MGCSKKCGESLSSKFRKQYNSHRSPLTPEFIADNAVAMFFFTIVATYVIGVVDVLPRIYSTSGAITITCQRVWVTVIFTEMMLNWLCIKYVDSSYKYYVKYYSERLPSVDSNGHTVASDNGNGSVKSAEVTNDCDRNGLRARFTKPSEMDFSGAATGKKGDRSIKYPYWSWTPCFKCDVMRPPRCHHCILCNACVLKRDHHCYFAGSCVGWRNQRNFIIFCFWSIIGCSYALVHASYYLYAYLWDSLSYLDFFPPFTVLRCLLGFVPPVIVIYASVSVFLLYFVYISVNFLLEQLSLFTCGLTSFERNSVDRKAVTIRDSRTVSERIRATMGANWALSILVPLHGLFPPEDDPFTWPSVTVTRNSKET